MPIVGLRDTSGFTTTGQRPENWREALMLLYPNSGDLQKAPLTCLTSLMKTESTDDAIFHWFTKRLDDRIVRLSVDITNVATTWTINTVWKNNATAKICKAGDLLYSLQTQEIVRVSADPTADATLTVTRAVAGTAGTAITVAAAGINSDWIVIGSAFEEGSLAPSGVSYDPIEKSNNTQIFRSSLELTRTAMKTRLRTGEQLKESKREALEYIGVDMERAFWFGQKSATVLNGRPIRYTGGLLYFLNTFAAANVLTAPGNGIVDFAWFETMMEQAFRYGASEKIAFCGNLALMAVNQMVRKNSQYNIQYGVKEYGMNVARLTTPFGELVLKPHPLFTQSQGGITTGVAYQGLTSWMTILDMSSIKYRYLKDSDLNYLTDQQTPGQDSMKAGYIAECGLEIQFPEAHMIIKGLVGGTADAA